MIDLLDYYRSHFVDSILVKCLCEEISQMWWSDNLNVIHTDLVHHKTRSHPCAICAGFNDIAGTCFLASMPDITETKMADFENIKLKRKKQRMHN